VGGLPPDTRCGARFPNQQEVDVISMQGDFAAVYVSSTSKDGAGVEQHIRWADLFRFADDRIAEHVALSG
jgi:predicted SnoaL-like aldol condensation-catalyzing enzyme